MVKHDILEHAQAIAEHEWSTRDRKEAAQQIVLASQDERSWRVLDTQEYHCHSGHLTWIVTIWQVKQALVIVKSVMVVWDEEEREYLLVQPA